MADGPEIRPLRAVLVDDEPHARAKLRRFLADDTRVDVVAEAGDGAEAVRVLEAESPDLVFLDVQMPELDGFGVLAALDPEVQPRVIFVTAHDEHAIAAFGVRALDYLLKPVDPERFREAVDRAVDAHRRGAAPDARAVLDALPSERRRLDRFLVRERGRMFFVPAMDVAWLGAAGNYVELHRGGATHLVRATLTELEDRLDPGVFVRIHRGTIVNLDRVREFQPWSHGDLLVILDDGTELKLSRRYRDRLPGDLGG